jgi:hypothetical protein
MDACTQGKLQPENESSSEQRLQPFQPPSGLVDCMMVPNVAPRAHAGSGYLSAVMGTMLGGSGRVLGIERHPPLAQRSVASLAAAAPDLARSGTVTLLAGNALDAALLAKHGPFDAIHVGAAAAHLPKVRAQLPGLPGNACLPWPHLRCCSAMPVWMWQCETSAGFSQGFQGGCILQVRIVALQLG